MRRYLKRYLHYVPLHTQNTDTCTLGSDGFLCIWRGCLEEVTHRRHGSWLSQFLYIGFHMYTNNLMQENSFAGAYRFSNAFLYVWNLADQMPSSVHRRLEKKPHVWFLVERCISPCSENGQSTERPKQLTISGKLLLSVAFSFHIGNATWEMLQLFFCVCVPTGLSCPFIFLESGLTRWSLNT